MDEEETNKNYPHIYQRTDLAVTDAHQPDRLPGFSGFTTSYCRLSRLSHYRANATSCNSRSDARPQRCTIEPRQWDISANFECRV